MQTMSAFMIGDDAEEALRNTLSGRSNPKDRHPPSSPRGEMPIIRSVSSSGAVNKSAKPLYLDNVQVNSVKGLPSNHRAFDAVRVLHELRQRPDRQALHGAGAMKL